MISAGIFEGSPADRAELKPYESMKKHSLTQVKWKFEGTAPGGRWVLCSYEGQLFSLTKKLPDNVKECVVGYKKIDTKSQQLSSIVCK